MFMGWGRKSPTLETLRHPFVEVAQQVPFQISRCCFPNKNHPT